MKFLVLLAVLVAASFVASAPDLPTTYSATTSVTIVEQTNGAQPRTFKDTEVVSEDDANKRKLTCSTREGNTTALCRLTTYQTKTLYIFGNDTTTGTILNCTMRSLSGNASTYRNDWVWVPESKAVGSTTNQACGVTGVTWELSFEGKVDLKVIVNGNTPLAKYGKISNSTGSIERTTCYNTFTTDIDPRKLTPPSPCSQGLPYNIKEEDPFHGML